MLKKTSMCKTFQCQTRHRSTFIPLICSRPAASKGGISFFCAFQPASRMAFTCAQTSWSPWWEWQTNWTSRRKLCARQPQVCRHAQVKEKSRAIMHLPSIAFSCPILPCRGRLDRRSCQAKVNIHVKFNKILRSKQRGLYEKKRKEKLHRQQNTPCIN